MPKRIQIQVAALCGAMLWLTAPAQAEVKFQRVETQFIAALGDPNATSGTGADQWGIWGIDPGPRGVQLEDFDRLMVSKGVTADNWTFDAKDWWLEEHGLIMEQPTFPLEPGKYQVTGGREVTTTLTIYPKDKDGNQRWELENGAKLFDVTHLPCRAARYVPLQSGASCSPAKAEKSDFPVKAGAPMPPVAGCKKQDYAVLFITAVAVED
jgi:hypothetical protein